MNCKNILVMIALQSILPLCGMHREKHKQSQEIIKYIKKNKISFYDPTRKNEFIVFKSRKNALSPGMYYRTPEGLKLIPHDLKSNNDMPVVRDHLSHIALTHVVHSRMSRRSADDIHRFSLSLENLCSNWARVVVHNAIANSDCIKEEDKKFDLYITLPGVMNKVEYDKSGNKIITEKTKGVFEFKVRKTLYEQEGVCYHRVFSCKGTVGADSFRTRD